MKFDCKKIKSELSMQTVLNRYGITSLRKRGNSLSGCCPIHQGDNPNAFHVNLNKNLWNCFTRQHGGDVLSFIMEYEGVSFKEAAEIARGILCLPDYHTKTKCPTKSKVTPEKINLPLRFTLKFDPEHCYLRERDIEKSTIEHFGIGYSNKGSMKGRIAIPIHDENNNLVAYCGRSINGKKPKYKLPRGFNKSLVVYNIHRVKTLHTSILAIVEGFFDVFKVHQAGFPNVVALMGSSISEKQKDLILSLQKKLIIFLDGDQAGREGTKKIINAFKGKLPMTVKHLSEGTQPDNLKETELKNILKERRE